MVDVNPFDRVMNELKSRGRKNAHILSILQFDWPASEAIIEKLSCYITDGIQAFNTALPGSITATWIPSEKTRPVFSGGSRL
ncbi:hypothetical protein [Citrobacter freundii]|uniref:hypothetical protein n=1 Tax=Citrobacter freundii TaxID=546 RepID=UPI00388D56C2